MRSTDDPNELGTFVEVTDLDQVRTFMASDNLRETMQRAGMTDQPDISVLEEIERGSV